MTEESKRQEMRTDPEWSWSALQASAFDGNWKRHKPLRRGIVKIEVGASITVRCNGFESTSEFYNKTFTNVRWNPPISGQSGNLEFENTHQGETTTYQIMPADSQGKNRGIKCRPASNLPETWDAEEGG